MPTDRIDFISAYCDRWCERCRFTERCSAYACHAAIAMCDGDMEAALELAVGRPASGDGSQTIADYGVDDRLEPSGEEVAAAVRDEHARSARVALHVIKRTALAYTRDAHEWLARAAPQLADANPAVRDALEIVTWDSTLIAAKLHRALVASDRTATERAIDDDPVQNDANGSAKIALVCLERSEASWLIIGEVTGDAAAVRFAHDAARLSGAVRREFPFALDFIRPGFDEPWR